MVVKKSKVKKTAKPKKKVVKVAQAPEVKPAAAPIARTLSAETRTADGHNPRNKTLEEAQSEGYGVMLSINQAATEFDVAIDTMRKRIVAANLVPPAKRHGYPVFRLRDILKMNEVGEDGELDPRKMQPMQQNLYYKAQNERLKLEATMAQLFPREQVAAEFARVLKVVIEELETLGDKIERQCRPPTPVLEAIEAVVIETRERMREAIAQGATTQLDPLELAQ